MRILRTARLDLVPATLESLELVIAGEYRRAGHQLGVTIPEGWPHEREPIEGLPWHLRALHEDPASIEWRIRLVVLRLQMLVIGSINLKGPPDSDGMVEIGWGVTAEHRNRGIAMEATQAVIEWVLEHDGVRRVIATIPRDNHASQRVAGRLGMALTQEVRRGLPVWELRHGRALGDTKPGTPN
jgi:RimJ/RimL family protein N-acetyltransferase